MLARLARRFSLAPLLAAALGMVAACAPEQVDLNIHDIFTGDAARYALQTQMSPTLLASVGGFLPAQSWPTSAAPLLLDVQVVAENKIDLSTSNLDLGSYSGMRLHWAQLVSAVANGGPLTPRPTTVDLYVGPASATALTDDGVHPLASGAFPLLTCDGGDCADGGPIVEPLLDGGAPDEDAGPELDAGPVDAGAPDAGIPDAGSSAGSGSSPDGGADQLLVFSSDAQLVLQSLIFAGQPFALFVVLHLPIDSAADPQLPAGGVDLSFDVQFELAR